MESSHELKNVLEVVDLSVQFDSNKVLENINFTVKKGEVLAVVGPNGAGKTVLFKALLNLIPYFGEIEWQPGIKVGYVPQKLAVERNMPLTIGEFFDTRAKTISHSEKIETLQSVGLAQNILHASVSTLSGGQFQRIMIAWAMLGNPDVLLFDEPTAGIDVGGEETIYNLLHRLQESNDLTIILISHDLNIVYKYADNVICLNKQQICFGVPNEVLDPKALSSVYGEAKFFKHEHQHS